ncbi:UbiA family prenyltransferase [Streptomyces sp. NPDC058280]|uniref:UbiA family prenyltransferase n=1 Tax=Streptomyces sp. NPDC058280 TaxID=3346419 RepID=UPI0036F0DBB0
MTVARGGALRAHLETWRPYTLAYPGVVGLAGAAAGGGTATAGALLAAWAAPTLGWLGGHYLGDYFDRDLDAIGKPQRPIPSRRLSPGTARACGIGAVLAAAVVTVLVNWPVVIAVFVALAGVIAYSLVLKGRGILGNAVRGVLTAIAVLFGAAVTVGVGDPPSWRALPVAIVFLLHDTASNLVGTLRDVRGDRAGGYRTLPVRRGLPFAIRTASALHLSALLVAAAGTAFTDHPTVYLVLLVITASAGVPAFVPLLRSGAAPTARLALRSHEVLVGERLVLAGAVLAGGWGPVAGLAVLLPLLAISLVTQRRMRARHEFPPEAPGALSRRQGAVAPARGTALPRPRPGPHRTGREEEVAP